MLGGAEVARRRLRPCVGLARLADQLLAGRLALTILTPSEQPMAALPVPRSHESHDAGSCVGQSRLSEGGTQPMQANNSGGAGRLPSGSA